MSELAAGVAAYVVVLTLLVACAGHLSRPGALPRALLAHRVLPVPSAVAAAVTAAEGLLGGAGAVALGRGNDGLLTAAMAASAVLLALFGGYAWYVTGRERGGPCGCSRADLPMTGWVVARAFVLAGLALAGLVLADSAVPPARPGSELAVVLLAAATFTCLLWQLPAAMYDPDSADAVRGPGTGAGPVGSPLSRVEGGVVRS